MGDNYERFWDRCDELFDEMQENNPAMIVRKYNLQPSQAASVLETWKIYETSRLAVQELFAPGSSSDPYFRILSTKKRGD